MSADTANLFYILLTAAALGLLPALVAQRKGRSPLAWWLFGFALAIIAIPAVFIVSDLSGKKCPKCAEQVKRDALVCRFCQHQFGVKDDWKVA